MNAPARQDEPVQTPHRFVVVEGPIGVGKTSLARRLAKSFGSELVLEQVQEHSDIVLLELAQR